jgi:16S rRNA (uracil1498-N3)-methyltransferase
VSGRVRIPIAGLERGGVTLDSSASKHLAVVLRLGAGDTFVAFDPKRAVEAEGRIVSVVRGTVRAELGEPKKGRTLATLPVTWIQGLAKGEKMDAIVRDATELAATCIVPAVTAFSVVQLDGSRASARKTRWEKIAVEAARQCGRADPPTIEAPCSWHDALALAEEPLARFCLYERATEPLGPALSRGLARGAAMAFAVGPAGGLAASEVDEARAAGFEVVSLGELILRTETVVAAVLGAVRVFTPAT